MSKILVDIAVLDSKSAWWKPSEMVGAACFLAYKLIQRPIPEDLFELMDLKCVTKKAQILASQVPVHLNEASKLQGLRTKYMDTEILKTIDQIIPALSSLSI